MTFEEKFDQIVKDRGIPQAELARRLGMPYPTFRYKMKRLNAWKVPEFRKLMSVLNLSDEEVDFLSTEVN